MIEVGLVVVEVLVSFEETNSVLVGLIEEVVSSINSGEDFLDGSSVG